MKNQVVILAGGESSRFYPFNRLHKSFFGIGGKSILERTLLSVKKADPSEIILVLGQDNYDEEKKYCQGLRSFEGVKFVPQSNSLGQADAVLAAKGLLKGDFFVINAQQFDFDTLAKGFINKKEISSSVATIGLTKTESPQRYGIAKLEGNKVRGVVEKPEKGKEPSNMRVVGIYLLSKEFLDMLQKHEIRQYLLEDVLNGVAKKGGVSFVEIKSAPPSLKYPWDILDIKDEILAGMDFGVDESAKIAKTAVLKGDKIFVGKNAEVYDFAIIEGPAYLGEGAVVGSYCQVRGGSILEKSAQIERYTDLKNSHIGENTHIHSGFIGDSVIGRDGRIGANFIVANRRLDRQNIGVVVNGEKIDTGKSFFGAVVGDNVKIGIGVSVMPGAVIGSDCEIPPNTQVRGIITSNSTFSK
jgi:NDP-sugar pyrophosphorylase family protein